MLTLWGLQLSCIKGLPWPNLTISYHVIIKSSAASANNLKKSYLPIFVLSNPAKKTARNLLNLQKKLDLPSWVHQEAGYYVLAWTPMFVHQQIPETFGVADPFRIAVS